MPQRKKSAVAQAMALRTPPLGGAPQRGAFPLRPSPLHFGQVLLRRAQRTALPAVARVAEELPVPRCVTAVRTLVEARAHEPAVRARGGLIDTTDAPAAHRPGMSCLHETSARVVIYTVARTPTDRA